MANDYDEEEEDDWEQEADWNNEAEEPEDVKDESAAYLEFLNEEVSCPDPHTDPNADQEQAQKFSSVEDDDDDELEEESLLETPLDKVEPYGMFKHALLRKLSIPPFPDHELMNSRSATRTAGAVREPHKESQP